MNNHPGLFTQHSGRFTVDDDDMDSSTVAESDLPLKSRSFLHRVNDRVRKRQKQLLMNVTEDGEKHSMIWRRFMSSTLESSVFIGKNCSDNWHSIKQKIS